mgnify:CR=1 FL=1
MRLIGFKFTKISIERLNSSVPIENLKVNTEIDVPEIKKINLDAVEIKGETIELRFLYKIKYEPDFAKVDLGGQIIFSVDSKTAKEILKEWKNKKMPEEFRLLLFNIILKRSTLKALQLEEELGLPLHMPMPRFKKEEK